MAKKRDAPEHKKSGGSTLKRLKSNLKNLGLIGPKRAKITGKDAREKLCELESRVNPFELKVNKKKHDVLGQRVRGDMGKPTISRQRGNENVP